MTNNPNANLIEAMKEKLPLKGQLADMLMDTLYIGKEAVYRRLRGEVPFTLQESALISRKLGISLDKIIGLSFKSNAMFNINIVDYDDPFESYYNILEKYVSLINTMPDDPNSVMGTSANIIPQPSPNESGNHSTTHSPTCISPHNSFPPQSGNAPKASTSCSQFSESASATSAPYFHPVSPVPLHPVRFPTGHSDF